jgi:hypothetical protein
MANPSLNFESPSLFAYSSQFQQFFNGTTPEYMSEEDSQILFALSNMKLEGPSSWGPLFWTALHLWSILSVPMFPTEKEQQQLVEMLQKFWPSIVPCSVCSQHFAQNAKRISGDIDSGLKLFKKLVDMHNSVNVRIGTNEKKYLQVATALQNPSSLCDAIKRSLALEESPNTFTDGPETIRIPYYWSAAVVSSAIILVACIMWWWNTRCSYILRRRD